MGSVRPTLLIAAALSSPSDRCGGIFCVMIFCMHQLFSKHPALWRAMAGLIVGTLLLAVGALLIATNLVDYVWSLMLFAFAPIFGTLGIVSLLGPSDIVQTLVTLLFYPVLGCVVGLFIGHPQRVAIVVLEIVLVAMLVGVWAFGAYILFTSL